MTAYRLLITIKKNEFYFKMGKEDTNEWGLTELNSFHVEGGINCL
jgi:hypothetical protein